MSTASWMTDPIIGKQLANFLIKKVIGRGGTATVYLGHDVVLNRPVAVKVIHQFYRDNPVYTRRMERESQLIATWRHPNIVQVYYADFENEIPYFVMEFIDGPDLRNIIDGFHRESQLMQIDDVLRIGDTLASALDFAHMQGVIHRDIKPSNVMVSSKGSISLTDFGLALELTKGTVGESFGTPHYMSPEQANQASDAAPASDLYSFGVILFEMLTGKLPFDADAITGILIKAMTGTLPKATSINPDLPLAINEVFAKALSRNIDERYATGRDLMEAIRKAFRKAGDKQLLPLETVVAQLVDNGPAVLTADMRKTLAGRLVAGMLRNEKLDRLVELGDETEHDREQIDELQGTAQTTLKPIEETVVAKKTAATSQPIFWLIGFLLLMVGGGLGYLGFTGRLNTEAFSPTLTQLPLVEVLATDEADADDIVVPEQTKIDSTETRILPPVINVTEQITELSPTQAATSVADTIVSDSTKEIVEEETVEIEASPTKIGTPVPAATRIENPDLIFIYTEELAVYLYNPTESDFDIELLSFIALNMEGQQTEREVSVRKWGNTLLQAGYCSALEVGTVDRSGLRDPRCQEFNWIDYPGSRSSQLFWVAQPNDGIDRFGVYWGGELLRTCEIDANVCRIDLPG